MARHSNHTSSGVRRGAGSTVRTVPNLRNFKTGHLMNRISAKAKAAFKRKDAIRARKRRPRAEKMEDIHSGVSRTHITCVLNPKPVKGAKGGNMVYSQSHQFRTISSAGIQNSNDLSTIGGSSQWTVSTGTGYVSNQSFLQYFDINPNEKTSGSGLYGFVQPLDDRLALTHSEIELQVGNLSNLAAFADIYFLKCKKDSAKGPTDCWTYGYAADAIGIAAPVVLTVAGATTGQGGYGRFDIVGAKPTDVKMFNEYWKIVKVRALNLAGGACEKINVKVVHNYLGVRERLTQAAASTQVWVKGCFVAMVVQHGATVMDKTGAGANPIVPGETELGFNFFQKHHFKAVFGNAARLSNKYMVTNTAFGAVRANQIFDDITDTGAAGLLTGTMKVAF